MKKVFMLTLFFLWFLYVLFPAVYYVFFGFVSVYSNIYDFHSLIKAFFLETLTIFGACGVLFFLPDRKKIVEPKYYNVTTLFYLAVMYAVIYFFLAGGFSGALSGFLNGTMYNYFNLFFSVSTIFLMILFYQKKKCNIFILLFVFVMLKTITGSRSAIITVIFSLFPFMLFKNYQIYKKKLYTMLILILLFAPVLYLFATIQRGAKLNEIDLMKNVIGRVSTLETAMIPVYCRDKKNTTCKLDIFYEKYNITKQLKQSLDALYPGDLFGYDVQPNQYYRSAFFGTSKDYVLNNYQSINMTLPVFLYLYSDFYMAVFLSIFLLICYYLFWYYFSLNNMFVFIGLITVLPSFFYFFDFVMWTSELYTIFLTILSVKIFVFIRILFFRLFNRNICIKNYDV